MGTARGCDPPQVLRSRSARAPARCSQGGRFPKKNASSSRASKPSRLACKTLRCDPPTARTRAFARAGACVLEFGINWPGRYQYHIVHFSKPKSGTNFCAKLWHQFLPRQSSSVAIVALPPLRGIAHDLVVLVSKPWVAAGRDGHAQAWQ